jgi:hypothetical protein
MESYDFTFIALDLRPLIIILVAALVVGIVLWVRRSHT